jgi:hypothetical protein
LKRHHCTTLEHYNNAAQRCNFSFFFFLFFFLFSFIFFIFFIFIFFFFLFFSFFFFFRKEGDGSKKASFFRKEGEARRAGGVKGGGYDSNEGSFSSSASLFYGQRFGGWVVPSSSLSSSSCCQERQLPLRRGAEA